MILAFTIFALVFQIFINLSYAQLNEFKITASDGDTLDSFGRSVSISGDYAVVGSFADDDNGTDSGSAYVFKHSGTSWFQEAKLLASDGVAGDRFGQAVSIYGDYIVVGAFTDDDSGDASGSAYVFKHNGTSWVQEAKLLASQGAAGDRFGQAVSISGDYVVVGAFANNDNGTDSGSAYVFKRSGASWAQEAKLLPSDGAEFDNFGFSVSNSGDYAVLGAFKDDDNGSSSGSAYVFKRSSVGWTQEAKLLPSDGAREDWFGNKVSISGDLVIVGAWGDDDNGIFSGSAYVFKRTGTSWAQEAKLLPSNGAENDFFGFPVSISDDHAVVGALGNASGSVFVFKRTGTSWTQKVRLFASDGVPDDFFGFSISISGDFVIVGAFADDEIGTDAGSVYLYTGVATATGVESDEVGLPAEFTLSQNYPNPFNPGTVIRYSIARAEEVSLVVYNMIGEEVAHLIDGRKPAGNFSVEWNATNFASGIYFYRLQAGDFVQTRKMVLLK